MINQIPSFTLCFNFKEPSGSFEISEGVFAGESKSLCVSHQNMAHILENREEGARRAIVLGSPIIGGRVDRAAAAKAVLVASNPEQVVQSLNGEFLIVLLEGDKLTVITDRFSSYPAFWAQDDRRFCLSYNYLDLARHCVNWSGFYLRPEKAYEFFVLQRLMGQDTHDSLTRSIPPATILSVEGGKSPVLRKYWNPDYKKNNVAGKEKLLDEFVALFSQSVDMRSREAEQKFGIFLSGGHDSRLVAAYTKPKATCYTLSFKNNLEVRCAKKIAQAAGHDPVFSQIDPNFFEKMLDVSTYISGALYATDHALFLPMGMQPSPQADIFLHGHGLDFMYQGMYLHAKPLQMFGRDTYIKKFKPLPDGLTEHFIKSIPFRSRYDMRPVLAQGAAKTYHDALYEQVHAIEKQANTMSDQPMDRWEYMVFHHPSRHYTFSNVLSKRICGELRTPSFDNALYDYYLRLPFEYRLHGDMLRGALYRKNPAIARMPAANHGLPAAWGPYQKTAATIGRKLLKHATFNRFFIPPQGKDRTWPDRDTYFRDHPSYYAQAVRPLQDLAFREFLDFIDWVKLEERKEALLHEPFGGVFLVTLLSYYKFYKAVMSHKK